MKQKTQWATICIFSVMLIIAIMAGCSSVSNKQEKSVKPPTDPAQIGRLEPSAQGDTEQVHKEMKAQREQAIKQYMDNAFALQQEQRYIEALGQLEQLLRIDPSHQQAQILMQTLRQTVSYIQQGQSRATSFSGDTTLEAQRRCIPYSDEITFPQNWCEISEKRQAVLSVDCINGNIDGSLITKVEGLLQSELSCISADEVWVIVKPSGQSVAEEDHPGCGAMLVDISPEAEDVPLPLKHTDVKGHIYGYIASVDVTQQFHNPFDTKIEAEYVFPLPQNAAVDEFIMTIGERKIRGIIREREEAEKIYAEARSQGYVASLLTQERPNIFTQKVANIEPGKDIDVTIHYFNTLEYVDGWYEFVFPMVVGPRYNPPHRTDGVGAVAHGSGGASGQKTEVQYLKPNQRSGHDISLSVEIDAGTKIEDIACTSHVVAKAFENKEQATISINPNDGIPNKDFVLRYKVAGDRVKSALVTHTDERGGYFTMMLYPPEDLSHLKRAPMEMIFVLDCSGSMGGYPIETAKGAIKRALKKLEPDDTFQVIRFSSNASQLGPNPVPATKKNIQEAIEYVDNLHGGGGTQMIEGIKAALDFEHDPERLRLVSFMTDGYIGNETEILEEVHDKLGEARIFSFGVGNSVNRYLLDRMAKLGKGAVAYIGLEDNAAEIIDLFYDRISHPALTDISIDWGSMGVAEVFPSTVPDLFVGRPVILTGKFNGNTDSDIRVIGTVGGKERQLTIPSDNSSTGHDGVAAVWARKKIEQLNAYMLAGAKGDFEKQIKDTALRYGLMSSYTAFIAVDSSRKTEGDHGVSVVVPVPVPDGVRYDTTVQD